MLDEKKRTAIADYARSVRDAADRLGLDVGLPGLFVEPLDEADVVAILAETFGEPRLDEAEGYRAHYFTMPGRPCISVMYVQVRRRVEVAA